MMELPDPSKSVIVGGGATFALALLGAVFAPLCAFVEVCVAGFCLC